MLKIMQDNIVKDTNIQDKPIKRRESKIQNLGQRLGRGRGRGEGWDGEKHCSSSQFTRYKLCIYLIYNNKRTEN